MDNGWVAFILTLGKDLGKGVGAAEVDAGSQVVQDVVDARDTSEASEGSRERGKETLTGEEDLGVGSNRELVDWRNQLVCLASEAKTYGMQQGC